MVTVVVLGALAAAAYRVMTVDERARARQRLLIAVEWLRDYGRRDLEPFWKSLRERTPAVRVTPVVAALNVVVFIGLLFSAGSASDPVTLRRWGASFGPATTNGEWWRIASATFVHGGFIALLIDTAALVQLGIVLERILGAYPLAAAYGSAAILAAVVHLWDAPMAIGMGASGAVYGMYGLFLAELAKGRLRAQPTIPIVAAKRLLPVTVAFVLFNLLDQNLTVLAELTGLAVGIVFGILVIGDVQQRTPSHRRVGIAVAAALTTAVVCAAPLRGIVDIRPEIQRLVDLERETADAYKVSFAGVGRNGRDIDVAVRVIETRIVPALREAEARVTALRGVPQEDRWQVTAALQYLRLRAQGWTLRVDGLRGTSAPVRVASSAQAAAHYRTTLVTLGQAEAAERSALQALERLTSP
jgi:membrane associated rhomboid family serine protease